MRIWQRRCLLAICGAFVGLINGFLGAGGGIVVVPILSWLLKLTPKEAHATAIFVVLPLCVVSGIVYVFLGHFSAPVFLPVLVGSMAGAVIGTLLLSRLKNEIIVYIFCAVLIFAGIRMIV